MNLNLYNEHWKKDFYYNIKFKRNYYDTLKKSLDNKFIINISGLRRVGKTTLVKQLIDYLIQEKNIERKYILFYSFDNMGEIEEKIQEYQKLLDIDFAKQKVYIFFDEIQKVPNWQSKIKVFYDIYTNIKFVLTGSSSLYLQKKESLAGRMYDYKIKPLFFDEYLRYKSLDYYLEEKQIYKDDLLAEFEKYLYRQFIDTIDYSYEEAKLYMQELSNKIIKEDITFYFKFEYPNLLISIFKIISAQPGLSLDYKNFADDLDIDQRTLEKYIYFLQEANLISKVYNFSKNAIKSERKLKKVYLNSCSFYSGEKVSGELFENYIQNTYDYEFFWRLQDKEVDFIDYTGFNIKAIEIKYKNKIKKNDLRGIKSFSNKFDVKTKTIITKDINDKIDDIDIVSFLKINIVKNEILSP